MLVKNNYFSKTEQNMHYKMPFDEWILMNSFQNMNMDRIGQKKIIAGDGTE